MFDLIMEDGLPQEEEAKKIFWHIVAAIKYCHNLDIVHPNIKLKNFRKDAEGNVKLIDLAWPSSSDPTVY